MVDFATQHLSELLSFLGGLVTGSLITFQLTRNRAQGRSSIVDQSRSRADGDIVGGNKTTGSRR